MVFCQLTIDANDPAVLARFWAQALGYQRVPPQEPQTTRHAHYRARLEDMEDAAFDDRLFDPAGLRPPIWFQGARGESGEEPAPSRHLPHWPR